MIIHSPIQKVTHKVPNNYELYIKRDDLIHPFISGNKWRKLKYLLKRATAEKKTKLVTFGGAYSNHLLATACAGASYSFKTIGFVRGESSITENPILFLCRQFGMEIRFVNREAYLDKNKIFIDAYGLDSSAFFIDEGGRSAEAIEGCAELIQELDQVYDHIFLASGTGSTFVGLLNGCATNQLQTIVNSIVVHKGTEEIINYTNQNKIADNYKIHGEYHFGGYAKTTPALINFMQKFHSNTGILLDPVYTGKAMFAIYQLMDSQKFNNAAKILFIHTGGLLGILGKMEEFKAKF